MDPQMGAQLFVECYELAGKELGKLKTELHQMIFASLGWTQEMGWFTIPRKWPIAHVWFPMKKYVKFNCDILWPNIWALKPFPICSAAILDWATVIRCADQGTITMLIWWSIRRSVVKDLEELACAANLLIVSRSITTDINITSVTKV